MRAIVRQHRLIPFLCVLLVAAAASGRAQAGGPATSAPANVSSQERHCVYQAHQADLAEMEVGQLAEQAGSTTAIQSAGSELAKDHAALDTKLIRVAHTLKLPVRQTVQQTQLHDRLSTETGFAFDHDCTASMMTAHQSMIAATRQEISHGSTPAVVSLAKQALPVPTKHRGRDLRGKMLQADATSG